MLIGLFKLESKSRLPVPEFYEIKINIKQEKKFLFLFIFEMVFCRHYFPVDFTRFNIPEVQGEGAGQVDR